MKKIIPTLLLIFSMLALSGCGGVGGINYKSTSEEIKAKATSSYDPYKKVTTIKGPWLGPWFIRGYKYPSGQESYQIYASINYTRDDSVRFSSAVDINGGKLDFVHVDTDVDVSCYSYGCTTYYTEDFVIRITRQDMVNALQSGMNIRVYSSVSGYNRTIVVTPKYINAILDVADAN
jgi:predicted small lipoprotein YifL